MDDKDLELAQSLCTRLCHDLARPVGAVAAGVEPIGGDPDLGIYAAHRADLPSSLSLAAKVDI